MANRRPALQPIDPESGKSNQADEISFGNPVFALGPRRTIDIRSISLTTLAFLAVIYTLYFAKPVILPVVLAILLGFVLAPPVRALHKLGIPEAIGAGLVVLTLVATFGYGTYRLAPSVAEWLRSAPQAVVELERKVRHIREPVDQMTEAADRMAQMASGDEPGRQVQVRQPSFAEAALNETPTVVVGAFATLVLLYFFLASGDLFLGKLVRVLPRLDDKKRAVYVARRVEAIVSRYLFSIATINLTLGAAVAITMGLLGMPNPLIWGAAAAILNFVPFAGAVVVAVLLTAVAAVTFDQAAQVLMPPLVFLALTAAEGTFFTPLVLGRRLALNPVVIFVSLLVWGALWGVAGVLLAVPLLVVLKVLCDHIEPLAPIGEFLGR